MKVVSFNLKKKWIVEAVLIVPLMTGCGSAKDANKDNFENAINAQLNESCIGVQFPLNMFSTTTTFPISIQLIQSRRSDPDQVAKQNAEMLAPYEALVGAGLLAGSDGQVKQTSWGGEKEAPGKIYSLTDAGKKALYKPTSTAFCAGRLKVNEVINFTEPGNAMGVTISQVTYTVKAVDVPAWAQSEAVKSAFPKLANQIENQSERQATLILQNDGWKAEIGHF